MAFLVMTVTTTGSVAVVVVDGVVVVVGAGVGVGKMLQVLKSGDVGPATAVQLFSSESRSWHM